MLWLCLLCPRLCRVTSNCPWSCEKRQAQKWFGLWAQHLWLYHLFKKRTIGWCVIKHPQSSVNHTFYLYLGCSAGVFWARVRIFILGQRVGFGKCGGLRWRKICQQSRSEVQKWAINPLPVKDPNYNSRWQHQKPGLSSVPFQNNACIAS